MSQFCLFLNVFGVIVSILCIGLPCIFIWENFPIRKRYREESDPEKKKQLKEEIKSDTRNVISSFIFLFLLFSAYAIFSRAVFTHEFTTVNHKIETIEVLFDVHVDSVISEKDKESRYNVVLTDTSHTLDFESTPVCLANKITKYWDGSSAANFCPQITLSLSESEYERLIGKGNNRFRTTISSLYFETESFLGLQHDITLYRIEKLSGKVFTEEEAMALFEEFLDYVANDCETLFVDGSEVDLATMCYN